MVCWQMYKFLSETSLPAHFNITSGRAADEDSNKMIDFIAMLNENLSKQRDLLLPRLMSGKLGV